MIATMAVPLVVCVVGILMFALSNNPKISEMGKIAFFVGLFFVVWIVSREAVHF